jgi:hypothetical protein
VFFASVSADGIGPWQTTTNYPDSFMAQGCFGTDSDLTCTGPQANSSYFAQLGAADPNGLQIENPPPTPRSQYLVQDSNNGPEFGDDIDEAIIFNCDRSQAATPAGCATTMTNESTGETYDVTIQYPCAGANTDTTNCCFSFGDQTVWCDWVGPDAVVIAQPMALKPAQSD